MKDKRVVLVSTFIILICALILMVGFEVLQERSIQNLKERTKQPVSFGATYMTMNNPYFEIINDEIKNVVKTNEDVLIALDPALSVSKQKEQIRYLLKQKVALIFVNAIEIDSLSDVLKECHEQGVLIIAVDTNLQNSDAVDFTVISDNYGAGVLAAKDMMNNRTQARIVLLEHSTTMSGALRIQGFVDTIKEHAQYQVVARRECEGQLEIATPMMNEVIEDGADFDVVMALNDPSALGALAALQEANIKDVDVYGVDGSPESKVLIKDGKMKGSISQSPKMLGKKAVEVAYQLLVGKAPSKNEYLMPVTLITQQNIHEFALEGWQ